MQRSCLRGSLKKQMSCVPILETHDILLFRCTIGTDGTVYVEGNSQYTITVDTYSTSADLTGASTPDNWSDYSAEKS